MAGGRAGPAAPEEGTEAAGGLYGGGGLFCSTEADGARQARGAGPCPPAARRPLPFETVGGAVQAASPVS